MQAVLSAAALAYSLGGVNVPSASRCAAPAMKDFPKPAQLANTDPYREATALSQKLSSGAWKSDKKKVAIIGGGLSGLACAKYLSDAGHEPLVLEARDVLGGKVTAPRRCILFYSSLLIHAPCFRACSAQVSAWQDEDGDWIETGLHIFFGAYPNMMNLFAELGIEDRLQWKMHKMVFAMQELPGEFTTFDFIPGIPAPFNFGLAILLNQKMLTLPEKLQTAPPLLPMLVEGQSFIDAQDELSVLEFMRKYGMPERINEEVFISMAKALDFIDPDKLSMAVVLTAMNRFLNEDDGLQMAFLDGNQPDRLCAPMAEHVKARGGEIRTSAPVKEIVTNDDGTVAGLAMRDGTTVTADEYVSAVPVDIFRRMMPEKWQQMPYFRQARAQLGAQFGAIRAQFGRNSEQISDSRFPHPAGGPARGDPGDQPAHVVRPQAGCRRPPLLLALAAALGVRRHVGDVQGVLRPGEVDARARVRAVLAARRRRRQLDRQEGRGDHRRHDGYDGDGFRTQQRAARGPHASSSSSPRSSPLQASSRASSRPRSPTTRSGRRRRRRGPAARRSCSSTLWSRRRARCTPRSPAATSTGRARRARSRGSRWRATGRRRSSSARWRAPSSPASSPPR